MLSAIDGNGTFLAKRVQTGIGGTAPNVISVDLDEDGDLDLISAVASTAYVMLGNGNGTFLRGVSFATGANTSADIIAVDFNGDGYFDIASADASDDTISILLGNGNGTFKARSTFLTDDDGRRINSGDFNQDGIQDLVTTNNTPKTLSILLGNSQEGITTPSFNLKTVAGAREALVLLGTTQTALLKELGSVGSYQSRLGVAASTLSQLRENLIAAESRIVDADIAQEAAELVRLKILQKAAQGVLAQANQQPKLVLALLDIDD